MCNLYLLLHEELLLLEAERLHSNFFSRSMHDITAHTTLYCQNKPECASITSGSLGNQILESNSEHSKCAHSYLSAVGIHYARHTKIELDSQNH